jgi:signal peptidase
MKNILKFVMKFISWTMTIAILFAVIGMVILPVFGIRPYVVLSGSMEPNIPVGGVVWINTHEKDVSVNDVVAYTLSDGNYVTHRIVGVEDGNYILKGDANETEDLSPVSPQQIIGKYMFCIPRIGFALTKIQDNKILLVPIISAVIAVMLLEKLVS